MNTRLAALLVVLLCCSVLATSAHAQATPQTQPTPAPNVAAPEAPVAASADDDTDEDADPPRHSHREIVHFGENAYLGKGDSAETLVAIGGSATSEGAVNDAVVAVFGNTYVSGNVEHEAVAVFGDLYIDGHVGSEAVAVMGNVTLGPNAVVDNDVTAIGGTVSADPAAVIRGDINQVLSSRFIARSHEWLQPWFRHAVMFGRPLAFEPGLGWAWRLALIFLALYVIIGAAFPKQVSECTQTFESHPGQVVLAGLLTLLLLPLLSVVLAITVIGLPVGVVALFIATLFGKAAVLAALGRRVTRFISAGPFSHVAFAVLVGGIIVLGLYVVPVVGFISMTVLRLLSVGAVVYWLLAGLRSRRTKSATTPPGPPVSLVKGEPGAPPASEAAPAVNLPLTAELALPRAGFWIRMAALFVDLVIVGVVVKLAMDQHVFLVVLAGYGALMWKLKGTTIGGTLCNLQIVRLDGRELDWATVIVRALACFLSLVAAGLGFFWIAFDPERQAWHDKIAGTVVLRTAKTVALV